jgi:hypothetical protein
MRVAMKKVKKDVTAQQRLARNVTVAARIRRDAEREATHKAKMQKVAEEIINPAPPWLSEFLFDWSFELRSARSVEEIWPTRQELWDELVEIYRLADRLDKRL